MGGFGEGYHEGIVSLMILAVESPTVHCTLCKAAEIGWTHVAEEGFKKARARSQARLTVRREPTQVIYVTDSFYQID